MPPKSRTHFALSALIFVVAAASALAQAPTIPIQPRMGEPLDGLTAGELSRFDLGKSEFNRTFTAPEGLGPIFNQNSCASCHNNPVGGSGTIKVTRFGLFDPKGGGFDPLAAFGGSLLQSQAISMACQEVVSPLANIVAERVTTSTLGLGLIEAIPDSQISANSTTPPSPNVSGSVHMVPLLEDPGAGLQVGRLGWKAQLKTVLSFSGDATLQEMGITNRLVGSENAPNGDPAVLAACDTVPDPEDGPDAQGFDFIDRVTDFQRFLAAPPQTPKSGMTGETIFNTIGCADCHVAQFTTANDPALEAAISNKTIRPYSDFLLHDMGQAADFIEQGGATMQELKTPPLWGVRVRDPLWHDGRVAGGTFFDRIANPTTGAIFHHNAFLSEAAASATAFFALSAADQQKVVDFLDSLGKAEFDSDGDNDVDYDDLAAFNAAMGNGPYTADDPEAVHDIDQDGDVDAADYTHFIHAFTVDCNNNGESDLVDILVNGTSFDANNNLIPDECEFCQTDLGGGGPTPGLLSFTICGDQLANPGTAATALIDGIPVGSEIFMAASTYANHRPIVGGGILVPGFPFTFFSGGFFPDANGQFVVTVPGGGPAVTAVIQAATVVGTTIELTNAVELTVGM